MFDKVYYSCLELEQKEFMKAIIEKIELYPEKREDGCWIKHITFDFPIPLEGKEVTELCLEKDTLYDVQWLPADITLVSKIEKMMIYV